MARTPVFKFPSDWDERITMRGFSRAPASKGYLVRITIAGRQQHVASAHSQEEAARLYDLAQWYLAPKIARKPEPNYPDDFEFITREKVERECPNIISIFNRSPYLSIAEEGVSDDELRSRRIAGQSSSLVPKGLAQYNDAVMNLRRQRGSIANLSGILGLTKLRLPLVQKLAQVPTLWDNVIKQLGDVELTMKVLEESLEAQRAYYQGLAARGDNPE